MNEMRAPQPYTRIFLEDNVLFDVAFSEYDKIVAALNRNDSFIEVVTTAGDQFYINLSRLLAICQNTIEGMKAVWEDQQEWDDYKKALHPWQEE